MCVVPFLATLSHFTTLLLALFYICEPRPNGHTSRETEWRSAEHGSLPLVAHPVRTRLPWRLRTVVFIANVLMPELTVLFVARVLELLQMVDLVSQSANDRGLVKSTTCDHLTVP